MATTLDPIAAAPAAAVNSSQLITVTGSAPFRLGWGSRARGRVVYTDLLTPPRTAVQVRTALRALATIDGAHVDVSGGSGGPYTVEFVGDLAGMKQPKIVANRRGVTVAYVAEGSRETGYGLPTGAVLATEEPALYQNMGTPTSPTLSPVGGGLQVATVTLTDAEIKALPTTPAEIVAAPGPNQIIRVLDLWGIWDARGGAYAGGGAEDLSQAGMRYGWINPAISFTWVDTGGAGFFLADGTDRWYFDREIQANEFFSNVPSDVADKPLVVFLQDVTLPLTGGDPANTLKVTVFYAVVDVS